MRLFKGNKTTEADVIEFIESLVSKAREDAYDLGFAEGARQERDLMLVRAAQVIQQQEPHKKLPAPDVEEEVELKALPTIPDLFGPPGASYTLEEITKNTGLSATEAKQQLRPMVANKSIKMVKGRYTS